MAISEGGGRGIPLATFFSQKSFVQVALDYFFGCPSGENSPPKKNTDIHNLGASFSF